MAPSVGWSVLAQVPLIGRAFVMALLPTRLGPLQSKWWLASLAVVCQFARTEGTDYYNVADMISQENEGATALYYYPDDGYGYTGKCRIVRPVAKPGESLLSASFITPSHHVTTPQPHAYGPTGTIPTQVGDLTGVVSLSFGNNQGITGTIPTCVGPSVECVCVHSSPPPQTPQHTPQGAWEADGTSHRRS